MVTIGEWAKAAQDKLSASDAFQDEIQLTLKFLCEARIKGDSFHFADKLLSGSDIQQLDLDLEQLAAGVPLPYVINEWSFFGLDFYIDANVLIPRPETELLVEEALSWMRAANLHRPMSVMDVGTGSGIIAIAIASHFQDCHVTASDISPAAIQVCQKNIKRHCLQGKITAVIADGIPAANEHFDVLCANLPYIPSETLQHLQVSEHEPTMALDGGLDGLRIIEKVIKDSVSRANSPALLLFEIEAQQGDQASVMANRYFPHSTINIVKDLSENERLLRIETQ